MPVIRFVREGRDVECFPGENLREVAMREGIQLYGLKGQLGNCGGCGQCVTCFVAVVADEGSQSLSVRTPVEEAKLRRRPQDWRLACQAMVERSVMVLTRPQVRLPDAPARLKAASEAPLPLGPTAWPALPETEEDLSEAATADEEG
ncbi:2Fe-2S iron-sulfur cluster-binding protein [Synechococcus sp. MIT S1220]|uniref:2Fe-2S iron-sulfur cluster-binding protein n=1 Tax=Synechococcus sp. MIT S1220 TaxID=3082549 RepID=UPI0039B02C5D